MPRDETEAAQLAPAPLDGTYDCTAIRAASVRGLRGSLHSVKPWRLEDVIGKPLGRRG